jgi:glucose/arabinose dehydrogenase
MSSMRTTPRRIRAASLLFAALAAGGPAARAQVVPPGFVDEPLIVGLDVPTAFAFTPDGRIFVCEQQGRVRVIEAGAVLAEPALQLQVTSFREQGLLGIAFHPQFPNPPYVYLVYTPYTGFNTNNLHHVSRFTVNGDLIDPASEVVLFAEIPTGIGYHVGGCIRYGPDGNLWITSGDTNWAPPWPQDLSRLEGKLLRLRPDGGIPADNPFVGVMGARPEIYQYGLRNPYRFSFQPGTGLPFIGDVGASDWEEINVGPPGANFGWPLYEGAADSLPPGFTNPIHAYNHAGNTAAIVGNLFYTGNNFPAPYVGNYFFFDHARGDLGRMVLDSTNAVVSVDSMWLHTTFAGAGYGPVELVQGPDGALYYSTYVPGQIRRIAYTGAANRAPTAIASATPTNGYPPLPVSFNGSLSYDVDGDSLSYEWNFSDGSPPVFAADPTHEYGFTGTFAARLTVRDPSGATHTSASIPITVGNLAPIIEITSPTDSIFFLDHDIIPFSAGATDPETGPLPGTALHWNIFLHHLNHIHPVVLDETGAGGSFEAIFHGEDPFETFYRIRVWAEDAQGLRTEKWVDVLPDPDPPGPVQRTFSIAADDRDATSVLDEVRLSGYSDGKRFDYVTTDGDSQSAGMQFQLDLPVGALILSANLLVRAGPTQAPSPSGAMRIRMYDVDDCTPFVGGMSGDLATHHPLVAQGIDWADSTVWVDTQTYTSPDVTTLVQAFVDRPGYVPGNHLGFVVTEGTLLPESAYSWADFAAGGTTSRLRVAFIVPAAVERHAPRRVRLLANVPNPFNPSTVIHFESSQDARTRLSIHDVGGRLVRVLVDETLAAGSHRRRWDGRDAAGRAVASGVYVARIESNGETASRRLVLIR